MVIVFMGKQNNQKGLIPAVWSQSLFFSFIGQQ